MKRAVIRWGVPVVAVAVAALIRFALEPWLGVKNPYGLFFLAVTITAVSSGFQSALLATALSALTLDYLFIEPTLSLGSMGNEDLSALLLFIGISIVVSLMGLFLQRGRRGLDTAMQALQRQAALIDLSPDAIITRTLDGTIKTWSRGAENLYGWTKEEAVGRTTHDLLRTEFPEPLEKIVSVLETGQNWMGTLIHTAKDGRKLVVQSFWHSERIDGETQFLESNVDITERTRVEEALRLQAAALDAAPNAISISQTDPNGTIVWTNPAFTTLTGYSAEEVLGKTHAILHSGEQDEAFYQELWDTISRGEVWHGELINRRKDGKPDDTAVIVTARKKRPYGFLTPSQGSKANLINAATATATTGTPQRITARFIS